MTFNKLFHHILLITAFVYLVMCPSVYGLGDNIRHDVVHKVGTKTLQKDFKNGLSVTPLHFSNNTQNDSFVQLKYAQKHLFFSPLHSTLNLSILSTGSTAPPGACRWSSSRKRKKPNSCPMMASLTMSLNGIPLPCILTITSTTAMPSIQLLTAPARRGQSLR